MKMFRYIVLVVYLICTVSGMILVKKAGGMPVSFENGIAFSKPSWQFIVGIISYGISFVLMTLLLSMFRLSFFSPVTTGVVQAAVVIASYFILGEKLTPLNIVGVVMIIGGVAFVATGQGGSVT